MAAAVHKLFHPHSHAHADKKAESQAQSQSHAPEQAHSDPATEHARDEEKRKLAHWEDHKHPLSPSQIHMDPARKLVGHSSGVLRREDFELLKTLGTGAEKPRCWP